MSLRLYGYWRSSATYRVRIALNLKHLEYTYVPVHLVKDGGEQLSEKYQLLNPAKLVPTFVDEDEDVTLNQSLAIIEYIDEKYQTGESLIPEHTLDRARVRMISQDMACDIQPVTNLRVLNKLRTQFAANDDSVQLWAKNIIENGLAALEKRLVTRAGKYAYGYDITMADVCLVPQVYNALRFGVNMQQFPIIHKVYTNCQKLEAFIEAAPDHQTDAPVSA